MFMTVADPVGSGIIRSLADTDRTNMTGTWSRTPETMTSQTMRDLMPSLRHIGLQFNGDEKNSTVRRDETALAAEQGLTITARESALDAGGARCGDVGPQALRGKGQEGAALISVAARCYGVGQLAGEQAERILFDHTPGRSACPADGGVRREAQHVGDQRDRGLPAHWARAGGRDRRMNL
ncbi:hypothetical protein [Defluviimonas sp. WL0075]|uniref:Uncharacterized protein n=1 Tax=Albidovulum sediminicola TaxID=2984331 RepID=A0ABT2Z4Z9_9RHOB|nr:hypothetical protein [Defluviimonas sp. WL0075]MCV2866110.1 hypothetical protein [Defluviimonas sp. WL0075]